nr:MAG TPA: hypothetical protein [Caudoviricetes sp.]
MYTKCTTLDIKSQYINVFFCLYFLIFTPFKSRANHEYKKTMDSLEFRHLANESQYQIDKITSKSRANQLANINQIIA